MTAYPEIPIELERAVENLQRDLFTMVRSRNYHRTWRAARIGEWRDAQKKIPSSIST